MYLWLIYHLSMYLAIINQSSKQPTIFIYLKIMIQYVAMTGLEHAIKIRLTSNSQWSSWFCLLSAETRDMRHDTHIKNVLILKDQ